MSTPEIGLYPDATADEHIAYEMGWRTAQAIGRAAAFGAIRRAAEVARYHDREGALLQSETTEFSQMLATDQFCQAASVREAIRAAIGSDKA